MHPLRKPLALPASLALALLSASCRDAAGPDAVLPSGPVRAVAAPAGPTVFPVDPVGSFLRTEAADSSLPALVVDLAALGVGPGDSLRVERLGDFTFTIYSPEYVESGRELHTSMHAVFSSTDELLGPGSPARVPGAVGAGPSPVTGPTLFEALPTDIPQDFFFGARTLEIPAGARYLFVAVPDIWYRDNRDGDGNLAVRLTPVPATLPVAIDVKPGGEPNSIRLKGDNGPSEIPVAILSEGSFDARLVDPASVTLGNGSGEETPVTRRRNGTPMAAPEDVDGDGDVDLVLHFERPVLMANGDLDAATTRLVLRGRLEDGRRIRGEDAVRVIP